MSKGFTIVGLGEALWDVFPNGPRFGGAPANFACHAAMLGADASLVSRVGDDELGARAVASLRACGVDVEHVGNGPFPTGTVQVELDAAGKPTFEIREDAAWDHLEWSYDKEVLAAWADAVCFGTLCQRGEESRQTIRRFLSFTRLDCLRVFDVNLRQPFYDREVILDSLQRATVLKLNDDELPIIASMLHLSGTEAESMAEIGRRYDLALVALTRGSRGALLLAGGTIRECAGLPVLVVDTVGAGDAFTAALTLGWLRGRDLEEIGRHACRVAAFVCSQAGATPTLPEELRNPAGVQG
jgi:fructokinase